MTSTATTTPTKHVAPREVIRPLSASELDAVSGAGKLGNFQIQNLMSDYVESGAASSK